MEGVPERSHNDRRCLIAVSCHQVLELVQMVVTEFIDVLVELFRNAPFHLNAPVMPAVVATAHHLDPVRIGPRNTDARRRGI
jgi:hypothetical protein